MCDREVVYNVAYNIAIVCIYDDGDNTMTTLTRRQRDEKSLIGGKRDKERERENSGRERRSGGFYRERKDQIVSVRDPNKRSLRLPDDGA